MNRITVKELKKWYDEGRDFQLIDVREPDEYGFCNINGLLIPLGSIPMRADEIALDKPVVVHCRSGTRSFYAIKLLGFDNLFNLEGGILAWSDQIDGTIPKY